MQAWLFLAGLLLALPGWARPEDGAAAAGGRVLHLGKISDDPRRDLTGLGPLLDYVAGELAPLGVGAVEVIMARDADQMVSYLRQGRVDWVTETSGMGTLLEHRTGAQIVMNRWKYGEREYCSTLFARSDSAIGSVADLPGRTVAFEHPGSTTGFLAPALELHRAGMPLVLMASPRDRPPADMVGYFFSGDEINTSTWVHKGLVDAGAVSSTDWSRSFQVPDSFVHDLRIVHRGDSLPRAVELVRADLDPGLVEGLIRVLTTAHESDAGRAAIQRFQGTTRYERLDAAVWPHLAELRARLPAMLEVIR